jgi:hypothetical protein
MIGYFDVDALARSKVFWIETGQMLYALIILALTCGHEMCTEFLEIRTLGRVIPYDVQQRAMII